MGDGVTRNGVRRWGNIRAPFTKDPIISNLAALSSLLVEEWLGLVGEYEGGVEGRGGWGYGYLWRSGAPADAPSYSAGALGDAAVVVNLCQLEEGRWLHIRCLD